MKERTSEGKRKYKHVPRKRVGSSNIPKIDYQDARTGWFIYKDQAYNVEHAPMNVLTGALLKLSGTRRFDKDVEQVLFKAETDMAERWFLLCAMIERKTPLKLYTSQQEAIGDS